MATGNEHVRVLELDGWASEAEDDESGRAGSDMEFGEFDLSDSEVEFGEFDLSGARNLRGQQTVAGYEDDDDDDAEGCGAQFSVRPYRGGAIAGEMWNLQLSGFEARSDGPDLTDQHELTNYDMQHLVHLALEGGESRSMEDDEAYQRALAGGTPVSRDSRAAIVGQALQQSANQQQQQRSKPPSQIFPMRTGY